MLKIDRVRTWLGPTILALAVLPAGALLEIQLGATQWGWLARGYLVFALLLFVIYILGAYLPARRCSKRRRELELDREQHQRAVIQILEELRHGDLVRAQEPWDLLPADLAASLDSASSSLAGLVQQIQGSSVEVAHAAYSVRQTANDLASGSTQQAAAVVEITATMEELARTAGQIADNAASQAELADRSDEAGRLGADAVEAAVEGVESIRDRMEAVSGRAETLGSRARDIYRVLDLITEIAHETHILSLNAAIEAAAAGEHGERFAVVADEVRRLAERSRESVDSVRSILDEFSGAIRAVVVATEEGIKTTDQVSEESRDAERAIEQLSAALAETASRARETSLGTQEQQTASDQVVLTLKEVSEVIQRMAEGLNRFTGTAGRLNNLALSIQLLTQSFRIDSVHSLKDQITLHGIRVSDTTGNLEATEGRLRDLFESCPYVELAYVVDNRGAMVAFQVNRELTGDDTVQGAVSVGQIYSDRPWFQAVSRDRRPAITPVYESLLTGDQCFTIATAILDRDGSMVGTLGLDVNVRNWTRI
jgi:methyl-accepting chemotaxis protein